LYLYAVSLLFAHPAGWLLINLLIPIKAMSEYIEMHKRILQYILKRDNAPLQAKTMTMFISLIDALNSRWTTLLKLVLLHLTIMTFHMNNTGIVLFLLYASVFVQKMVKFNYFMKTQKI
jgi:hypothetical protein